MNDSILGYDIVLNEEAFQTAAKGLEDLSKRIAKLRTTIEGDMNSLQTGFNTPAGRKFLKACNESIYQPIDKQKLVLEHISQTLNNAKDQYSTVFAEYEQLKALIEGNNI